MAETAANAPETVDLPLGQVLADANQWLGTSLLNLMHAKGHTDLSGGHLTFFGSLDCGMTHASEVARRMGITRQAVYKITRELQDRGVLTLQEDPDDRRQKIIIMTGRGEQIALDARASLATIEARLADRIGTAALAHLLTILRTDWGAVLNTDAT